MPLDESIRELVYQRMGRRPSGPIRLLTHLSYFGYCFNPASFYYCFDAAGRSVETIVVEVNNTPWGERHMYVLDAGADRADPKRLEFSPRKEMHVSPFMEMDIDYAWRFNEPGDRLIVHMENAKEGYKVFDASLSLERREITGRGLAHVLVSFPLMTIRIMVAIHWQALKLWLKGTPVHVHPDKKQPSALEGSQ